MADNVNIIVQDTINDIVVNAAVIVETIDINVQVAVDEVQIIANPNNYVVNINRIIGEQVQSDWDQADDQAPDYIKNKPAIPTNTSDLTNDGEDGVNPFITAADIPASLLVALPFTTDHLTVTNNAYAIGDVVWYLGNVYRCIANNDSIIPTATAYWTNLGAGNPLVEQPTDWNSTSGNNQILNKPTIPVVTGFVPYTGATQDVDLGEFEIKAGQVEFDQTPTGTSGVGIMQWNDSDGTVNLGLKGGNVTLQIGQEQVLRVVNKTATNVNLLEANYQAVRVTGAQGQRLKVDLAQATNDTLSAETIGLVTETINNNQEGFITTSGLVRGINTTGSLQGETWADGDILYLSPTTAGRATKVKPTAPNHLIILGYVIHAHITQGSIFVKVDNGYELDELHNVKITSAANNNVLAYTSATDIWENKTVATVLGYTPFQLPALTSGSVLFSNGSTIAQDNAQLFWDDTNNRLGIGTATPAEILHIFTNTTGVNTTLKFQSAANSASVITFDNPDNSARGSFLATGSSFSFGTYQQNQTNLVGGAGGVSIRTTNGTNAHIRFNSGNANFNLSPEIARFVASSGNLLLNTTTDAGFKLDVNGTARVSGTTTITPAALTGTAATSALDIAQTWNTTGTPTAIKLNVTDTASNGNSRLLDIQVGGVSKLIFGKNGKLFFGTFNSASNIQGNDTSKGLIFSTSLNSVIGHGFEFANLQGSITNLSSTSNGLLIQAAGSLGFSPTSGTGLYNSIHINDKINQTGGANGITRGLYINPTLTAAADFRAIEVANGITILGASTTAKASLRIPSGTAPTTPTNGDIWFDGTDLKIRVAGVTRTIVLL